MAARRSEGPGAPQLVDVGGRRVRLTNLDKVLYPETGTTKADVIGYYAAIAPHILPFVRNRPATRKRWVHGVGSAEEPAEVFFQKNLDASTPDWVARVDIEHSDHRSVYPLVNDAATLVWFAQIASLEIHVPQWRVDARGSPQPPDRLVLDLDPGPGAGLPECVAVATSARAILQGMGLEPMPVTSGSKGIHLYAALDGGQSSDAVSEVAHELARVLESDLPDLVVSDMKKSKRAGKVLVDWSQNSGAKTTIAPYSLRGRTHPTVAVPRTWDELADPDLRQLEYTEVLARMAETTDPLRVILGVAATDAGDESTPSGPDRLTVYRSKRDAARTPEPVPDDAPAPGGDDTFVVQDHHARGHHHDFRLERDGVLVSWAVPKGVPALGERNRLAVQTEDHPLGYAAFEGRIPKGEYGAGTVTIWDAGTYVTEKWRDDEIIVTLTGRVDGGLTERAKIALIRTSAGGDPKNWLMHRMELEGTYTAARDEPSAPDEPEEGDEPDEGDAGRPPAASSMAGPPRRRVGGSARPSGRLPAPMLATRGTVGDLDDGEWAFEMKWDGIRCLARVEDGTVVLGSRNGQDLTATFPDVAAALAAAFPEDVVLDAEIVALERGRPDFSRLQNRLGLTKDADVSRAAARIPATVMVFDILEREGADLARRPYRERRGILDDLAAVRTGTTGGTAVVQIPPAFEGDVEHAVSTSRRLGLEGVVAKRTDAPYRAGRRSRDWIKLPHERTQEVVIVGWRPGNNALAESLGSLLVAVPGDDGELAYAGRVGTGFTDSARRRLRGELDDRARKTPPVEVPRPDSSDANWVRADLVGEVTFADWTGGGRLRHPVWRGLRPDKSPADILRDTPDPLPPRT